MSNSIEQDLIRRSELLQEFETEYVCHNTEMWHIAGIKAFIESHPSAHDIEHDFQELASLKSDLEEEIRRLEKLFLNMGKSTSDEEKIKVLVSLECYSRVLNQLDGLNYFKANRTEEYERNTETEPDDIILE